MNSVYEALNNILNIIISIVNPSLIASIIGILIATCFSLYLLWYGIKLLLIFFNNALHGRFSLESVRARRWYKKEGYKYYHSYDEYKEHYNTRHAYEEGEKYID